MHRCESSCAGALSSVVDVDSEQQEGGAVVDSDAGVEPQHDRFGSEGSAQLHNGLMT